MQQYLVGSSVRKSALEVVVGATGRVATSNRRSLFVTERAHQFGTPVDGLTDVLKRTVDLLVHLGRPQCTTEKKQIE